jgi:hypothetical protein
MLFSNEEKKIAHQTTYQVTNNIGSMRNSQLQSSRVRRAYLFMSVPKLGNLQN